MGGMKAVLITDVFQSFLMFAAVFAVVIMGLMKFGGRGILDRAAEGGRLEIFVVSFDPRVRHTIFTQIIGGMFTYLSLYGVNQAQVQRLLTVKSLNKSRASLWIELLILASISFSTSFAGLVLYSEYHSCDPKTSGKINSNDQLLPFYVVQQMGSLPGLSGLFVSGIFSGSLSTVSSALNSLAAVTVEDYIKPYMSFFAVNEEKMRTKLAKILSVCYGGVCIAIAFLTQSMGTGVLQASLIIFGAVGGPLLSLFTMGMTSRKANQKGAVIGLLVGIFFNLWIGFGTPKPPLPTKPLSIEGCSNVSLPRSISMPDHFTSDLNISVVNPNETLHINDDSADINYENYNPIHELYAISYMWVGPIGFILTFLITYFVSILTGGHPAVDPNLLTEYIWTKEDKIRQFDNNDLSKETEMSEPSANKSKLKTVEENGI